jgi:hypothetical protein
MLKRLGVGLGVVALAIAGGVASLPVAHSQGSHRETVTVVTKDSQSHETDIDADDSGGDSVGDYFVGHAPLVHGGRTIGRERHQCTLLAVGENFFQGRCSGTFHLNGRGNLEITGVLTFSKKHNGGTGFSILGGTGDFRDAGGRTVVVGSNSRTKFTFKVVHN